MAKLSLQAILLLYVAVYFNLAHAQSCNTDQNPYCRGNSKLEALCCPYPSICYWSNRDGEPACCPAGQDCRLNGGPGPLYQTPTQQSFIVSTLYTTYPSTYTLYTTTPTPPPQQFSTVSTAVVIITQTDSFVQSVTGAYSTATSAVGGAYTTVTSFFGGAFTTFTSVVGGAFSTVSQAFTGDGSSQASNIPTGVLLTLVVTTIGIISGALLL